MLQNEIGHVFKPVGWQMLWLFALWLGGSPLLFGRLSHHTGGSRGGTCAPRFRCLTGCTLAGDTAADSPALVCCGHRDGCFEQTWMVSVLGCTGSRAPGGLSGRRE